MLRPGRNVYCLEKAKRYSVLVDAQAYFETLIDVFEKAQHSIFIIGWDIDSRAHLKAGPEAKAFQLYTFLNGLTQKKPNLNIYLLCWNYSWLFTLDREIWPWFKPGGWGERIHFKLDYHHPWLSSHHQKVVIVDDQIAFVGGIDICENRWDTSAHDPESLLRVNSSGVRYRPWHDVQACVDGPIVQKISELGRERWKLATGQELPQVSQTGLDYWPENVGVDLREVTVGVARTMPNYHTQSRVREIYQLNMDLLRRARKFIYIENQYLTARPLKKILIKRLQEEDGPEIIVVLPKTPFGWLESRTICALQSDVIENLQEKDKYGRLSVLYPRVSQNSNDQLYVHSKVMIIDDEYLKVGSSNMNNRSLGVDTECDLVVRAQTEVEISQIQRVRWRLISEHLGVDLHWMETYEGYFTRLSDLIKSQNHHVRSLQAFPNVKHAWLAWFKSSQPFFDRHRPVKSLFFWFPELTWIRSVLRLWYFISRYLWTKRKDLEKDLERF